MVLLGRAILKGLSFLPCRANVTEEQQIQIAIEMRTIRRGVLRSRVILNLQLVLHGRICRRQQRTTGYQGGNVKTPGSLAFWRASSQPGLAERSDKRGLTENHLIDYSHCETMKGNVVTL